MSEVRHRYDVSHHTGEESSVYVRSLDDNRYVDVLCTCISDTEGTAEKRAERIAACLQACDGIDDPADLRRQRNACMSVVRAIDELDFCEGYTLPDSELPKLWTALTAARELVRNATP